MGTEKKKIEQLRTLFKYVSDSPKIIDDIFLNHKIRFTQPAALNDPLEFNPAIRFDPEGDNFKRFKYNEITFPSIHDWERLNLIEQRINNFGMLSLTDNPYSFEMWCHYANGHNGILIEFNIPDKSKPTLQLIEGVNLRAHKVKYVRDYMINMDRLYQGGNSIPFHKIRDAIFLRKTLHWRYEREYRIIRQLTECDTYKPPAQRTSYRDRDGLYLFPLSLNCISSIIFGINTSQELKRKIIKSCNGTHINFLQAIVFKDLQNKIDFIPIDQFGTIDKYLEQLPQIFTFDSIERKYKDLYITVNSLNEIPYYPRQPNDYDEFYKKQLKKRNK
ncbi:MAG TPA: hypothetical protein DDW84_02895 [Phycisphaerales bacterium]|nr:MAG: hypothetical protein A2Y13_00080 [Planctomycetes bacterium GWC2_45_44]HBG77785.1 hypothetical protein [Phycisphaerales bacterium]HBR20206.1 hypothetical protein [Phycisphaerales bacterium]